MTITVPTPTATNATNEDGGTLLTVTASANEGGAVSGLPLTFSTNVSTVTFSPATVITNGSGSATSQVFVPYSAFGSASVVTVANGGFNGLAVINGVLQADIEVPTTSFGSAAVPGGTLVQVTANATVNGAAAQGMPLAFSTNSAMATFNPASVITDVTGNATTQVLVPAGTATFVTVTGAGFSRVQSLATALPTPKVPLVATTIATPTSTDLGPETVGSPGVAGEAYSVSVVIDDQNGNSLPGAAVAFGEVGISPNLLMPAATTTGSNGAATSFVWIADVAPGIPGQIFYEISAAGTSQDFTLGGP